MVTWQKARWLGGMAAALGCNSVLGIEERDFVPPSFGGSDTSGAGKMTSAGKSTGGDTSEGGAPADAGSANVAGSSATAGAQTSGGSNAAGSTSGGTSGAAGSDSLAGMGGEPPVDTTAERADAITDLNGFHFENDCGYTPGHGLDSCSPGEICFDSAAQTHIVKKVDIPIHGNALHSYYITLRLTGVLEPRDYPSGCTRVNNRGGLDMTIVEGCDGFANVGTVSYNIYELKVQEPAQRYYLNGVPEHPGQGVTPITREWTISAKGQSIITFTFDDINGGQNRYCDAPVGGNTSAAYGGQYFQLDVLEVQLVP